MMLKSSSTPLLSSLISSKEIIDPDNRSSIKVPGSKHIQAFPLGQLPSSFSAWSSGPDSARRDDICLQEDGEWDFESHVVPWPSISRVKSETNLQNFGHGFNSSAKVAADGLLNSPTYTECSSPLGSDAGEISSAHQRQWSRRTSSLRRYSSLPVNISQQDLGFSDHALFKLPQVKEFLCPCEDGAEEADPTTDDRNSKLQYISKEHDAGIFKNSAKLASSVKPSADEDLTPKNFQKNNTEDLYASRSDVASDSRGRAAVLEQTSSAYDRKEETCLVIDGERYTCTHLGADGIAVACNSRGCRPLNASETLDLMISSGGLGFQTAGKEGKCAHAEEEEYRFRVKAEENFIRMLKENPGQPLLLRNYAHYLVEVRKDYSKAEEFFERAILEEPGDGELLADYAKLIWHVHEDEARAGFYFQQAVQAAPDDCYVMAAYASFLWGSEDANQDKEPFQSSTSIHKSVAPAISA